MCNQTVSLVAAAIEDRGIPTVTIQLLEEIARKIGPPRALCVPFAHGFPLGQPGNAQMQRDIILEALALIDRTDLSLPTSLITPPALKSLKEESEHSHSSSGFDGENTLEFLSGFSPHFNQTLVRIKGGM